jgi:DNA processing protein
VLGGALDKLYPPENRELARAITTGRGAVMSEYPMGRSPDRTTFPCRNRIVAGLSRGVIVTEAPLDSGAMNTAGQALEQGRTVLAVPGRVDMEGARGPNKLIREGAVLVQEVSDVLEEFEGLFPASAVARVGQKQDIRRELSLSPEEERVVRALWREPEMDFDELARRAELGAPRLLTLSLQMEMKRILRRLPGRRVALADGVREWCGGGGGA